MRSSDEFRGRGLPAFSLNRRITVLVLFVAALVIGGVATLGIPIELMPRGFTPPFLWVSVPWPDAPTREVLDKIVVPLEEEMSTISGLGRMITIARTGRARAMLAFKQGTDLDVAYRELRDRLERARRRFPDDVERITIHKEDSASIPVLVLGINTEHGLADPWTLIQKGIIRPLERVQGVASIEVQGLEEKEILIEVDRQLTEAAGLNIYELSARLADDNFALPSGRVFDGARKLLLRSTATFRSLEEIENLPITSTMRLADIATVTYEEPDKEYRVRANGKPAVAAIIFKEGEANAREVSRRLVAAVEELENDPRLDAAGIFVLFDQGGTIDESLNTLLKSGMIGGFLAVAVLLFFLRRFRLTMIIALSIPLSMVVALTVIFFVGESLNLISLIGLMICIGLLVDNSVVVAENIHRLHQLGFSRRESAIRGASEIALAVTMSTLTTVIVFLPASLVDGNARFFLIRMALPITVSLLASLLIALIFVPLAVYLTLSREYVSGAGQPSPPPLLRRLGRTLYEGSFGRLNRLYAKALRFSLSHRLDLVFALVLVFALTVAFPGGKALSGEGVTFTDIQDEERSEFEISVEMPQDTSFEESESWFLAAEKVIADHQEDWHLDGYFLFHQRRAGSLQGWFDKTQKRRKTAKEVTELCLAALPPKPGLVLSTTQQSQVSEEKGETTWRLDLYGEDPVALETSARDIQEIIARVEGVIGVQKGMDPAPSEMGILIDRGLARRYGADPQVIAGVVSYALRGRALPRYHDAGREVPVRVRFREDDRESLVELASFQVPTAAGFVPLSAVTASQPLATPAMILRRDKKILRDLVFDLREDGLEETRERLDRVLAGIALPEGISFRASARRDEFQEDMQSMSFALVLSILLIYLLMGFLFESFILPFSIVLTIPLSALGVWWIHFVAGRNVDFLGAVGVLLLVGVVVNNGIVLIDTVRQLRREGLVRSEAILQATDRRFRPIMMTAITTIGGMVPLALAGANSIGLSYTSFALTLIGGMSSATLLTLLVVPVFYTFFDDFQVALAATMRSARGREKRAQLQ